jgi:hypothetical protein
MPARPRKDILGFPGDECNCGRRASVLHCIACGSTRIYARSYRPHTHLNGETKIVETQLRCQSCNHVFIPEERQFCEAPPVSEVLAKLKVRRLAEAKARGEYLNPQEQKVASVLNKIQQQPTVESQVEDHATAIEPQPQPEGFKPPIGLTREEYSVADRAFRLEWAQLKLSGQDSGMSVEEYVERRLKGELFQ